LVQYVLVIMPFDFNALQQDPNFQLGIGMLGAASARNRPLLDAYQLMQQQKQQQLDREMKQQEMALKKTQAQHFEAQTGLLGEQAAAKKSEVEILKRNQDIMTNALAAFAKKYPGILGNFAAPDSTPQMQPQSQQMQLPEQPPTQPATLFPVADKFVSGVEGGFRASDAGKGPTNYGINQAAHPEVDVKSLTPEAAIPIRKQYWDAIGADNLPPQTALVAYDSAINQGPQYAKGLIQKTGGNPQLMINQRLQDYRALAKSPMYAGELPGWETRLNKLRAQLVITPEKATPTPVAPQQQSAGGLEDYRAMKALGGIMTMGKDPGKGFTELGSAVEPRLVQPGQLAVDATGKVTAYPNNPLEEEKVRLLQAEDARKAAKQAFETTADTTGMTQQEKAQLNKELRVKQFDAVEKSYTTLAAVPQQMAAIQQAREAFKDVGKFVGSGGETRLATAKFLNAWLGTNIAPNQIGNAELMRSALMEPVLTMLRQTDSNPTQTQQERLMQVVGTIGTDPHAIPKILDYLETRGKIRVGEHNRMVDMATKNQVPLVDNYKIDITNLPKPVASKTEQISRTGVDKSGRKVIQYSDGRIEYAP
jgi:glycosyl hydrolase family 108